MDVLTFFVSVVIFFVQTFGYYGGTETVCGDILNSFENKDATVAEFREGEKSDEVFDGHEFTEDDMVILTKEPGRDFVILNLSDIHLSDYDYRAYLTKNNLKYISELIENVRPDLITVTGDSTCADSSVNSIRRLTELFDSYGIPFAPVFGNHDDESNCDLNYLCDAMLESEYCLLRKGDPRLGVGNYVIGIKEGDELVEALVMTDSHHSIANDLQTEWFRWVSDGINTVSGGKSEISVFAHIPLPEYQLAYDEAYDSSAKKWRDGYSATGKLGEKICCARNADDVAQPSAFFAAMKESGSTKYFFCGHDHLNDFSVVYEGIRLTYCLKLGHGSGFNPMFNGGTVINVTDSGIGGIEHRRIALGAVKTLETIQ